MTEWTYASSSIPDCGMLSAESKTRVARLEECELEVGYQESPDGGEIGFEIAQVLPDYSGDSGVIDPPRGGTWRY